MTKEAELLARWHAELPGFRAWGNHVVEQVRSALVPIIQPIDVDYFLKTPVVPRLKADHKLVEKAFYRNKAYTDPYGDITDKVGTRFVVLLGSDIPAVVQAVEAIDIWTASRDRDYEKEQSENPIAFDYAAIHFVVRSNGPLDVDGVAVPVGAPCEIQIKTILQHAYSELTHDTIYKPQIEATPAMRRNAAKSMALLEATNDYFEKVAKDVEAALSGVREMTRSLAELYQDSVGFPAKPSVIEGLLIDAYGSMDGMEDYSNQISALIKEKTFLVDRIRERASYNPIFVQPSVLLVYLAIATSAKRAERRWPLTLEEIEPLLNDCGFRADPATRSDLMPPPIPI